MSRLRPAVLASLVALTLACATTSETGGTPPALPESTIALLLEQREALALTPEQVTQLSARNEALKAQKEPLLAELRALRPAPPADGSPDGGPGMDAAGPDAFTPMPAGGPGMRHGGAHMSPEARTRMERVRSLMEELESLDILAYRDVEPLLDSNQRTQAVFLIRQYHEQRQQQRVRRRGSAPLPAWGPGRWDSLRP